MSESKTPRTDAAREDLHATHNAVAMLHSKNPIEQIKQLTRDLAAALAAKERAEADAMSALDLVARIRQALGDDGKRMQDELIAWCRTLADAERDAERYRFIRDANRSDCITRELSLYAMETLDEYVDAAMEDEATIAADAAHEKEQS